MTDFELSTDDLYPRGEGPCRIRLYRIRAGERDILRACEDESGVGMMLFTAYDEKEFEGDDRVGLLDTLPHPKPGHWIINPFTLGRGDRKIEIGDKVESANTGWGQPYISGKICDIARDVATVLVDKPIRGRLTAKRSLKNLRKVPS